MLFMLKATCGAPRGVRTIDRSGERRLPVGDDGFARGQPRSVFVDKTMLIADVIDGGATCTLPCRPRRFGKTLNMTMLKSFFEIPTGRFSGEAMMGGLSGWRYGIRTRVGTALIRGAFPVVCFSFNTVKRSSRRESYGVMRTLVEMGYARQKARRPSH